MLLIPVIGIIFVLPLSVTDVNTETIKILLNTVKTCVMKKQIAFILLTVLFHSSLSVHTKRSFYRKMGEF